MKHWLKILRKDNILDASFKMSNYVIFIQADFMVLQCMVVKNRLLWPTRGLLKLYYFFFIVVNASFGQCGDSFSL
jgi:hypothetical protein